MGDRRCGSRVLVEIPQGKTPLGRNGSRWEDNTETDLQEAVFGDMVWIFTIYICIYILKIIYSYIGGET
jgi:hypothetical protein